ncbi:MAG: hypothetical protein WD875_17255 [Pirellulales bacterium]
MSEMYLLDCKCGKQTPVAPSQAGGEVRCACGAKVDVPTLRAMRRLPVAEQRAQAEQSVWAGRQRLWVVGAVLIAVGAVLGGYMRWNRPPPPDAAVKAEILENAEAVRQQAPGLSVSQARSAFESLRTTPLYTLDQIVEGHRYKAEYKELLATNQNWTRVAWVLAGLGVVVIASSHVLAAVTPGTRSAGKHSSGKTRKRDRAAR